MKIQSEDKTNYITPETHTDDAVIAHALDILEKRIQTPSNFITCPEDSKNLLKLKTADLGHEVFMIMYLNNRHGVISYEEMFRGTVDGANVYPREIVKSALRENAVAIIVAHNHPSGSVEPSQADLNITKCIKEACALVDIRLLDHFIIGGMQITSLAERGQL